MKHLTINEQRLFEIVKAINSKWSERYPNYEIVVKKRYSLTRLLNGNLSNFGDVDEDYINNRKHDIIFCINGMSYGLSLLNKKDNRSHHLLFLNQNSKVSIYHRGEFKKYKNRVKGEFKRQIGINVDTLSIENAYNCHTKIEHTLYKMTHQSGKISTVGNILSFMKKATFEDPIVKSEVSYTYEHKISK